MFEYREAMLCRALGVAALAWAAYHYWGIYGAVAVIGLVLCNKL